MQKLENTYNIYNDLHKHCIYNDYYKEKAPILCRISAYFLMQIIY